LFPRREKIHFGTFIHIGTNELNELPVLAKITRTDLEFHGFVPSERKRQKLDNIYFHSNEDLISDLPSNEIGGHIHQRRATKN